MIAQSSFLPQTARSTWQNTPDAAKSRRCKYSRKSGRFFASGQGKTKRRALADRGFDRDVAAMALDDLLADGQSHARAAEFLPSMQPLKHAEDPLEVLGFDSEAIVLH